MVKVATYFGMTLGAFMLWKPWTRFMFGSPSIKTRSKRGWREKHSFVYKEEDLASEERLLDLYVRWRSHHKISRSLTEQQQRFCVFKANLEYIHKVNKMDKPYKLGLNKFADMTDHEFRQHYTGLKVSHECIMGEKRANCKCSK